MSESALSIEDAARCLPEVVDRVRASGEPAVLLKSGEPVARIVPVLPHANGSAELIAFLRRWRLEHPEPDQQFADAIAQSRQTVRAPHNPWE
jgi:antitoxin (DNA-binding transcriptional repressor) of toxin-antitoxin stability system